MMIRFYRPTQAFHWWMIEIVMNISLLFQEKKKNAYNKVVHKIFSMVFVTILFCNRVIKMYST